MAITIRQHPLFPSIIPSILIHPSTYSNPLRSSNDSYGWHFQYLTIIGLALSTLTFACDLLADLTLSRRLFAAKNALSVASAPIECLITILYWGLRAVSQDISPEKNQTRHPIPLD